MTARQTGWRETFAGISVGVYQYDGQECGWWDIPTGTTVHMLDGATKPSSKPQISPTRSPPHHSHHPHAHNHHPTSRTTTVNHSRKPQEPI